MSRDYQRSDNKSTVAVKWRINRSYMYEIVDECEELIVSGFSQRRRGRRAAGEPATMAEARERVAILEQENRRLDEERERYYVRNEFMKVRLKWAEDFSQIRVCGKRFYVGLVMDVAISYYPGAAASMQPDDQMVQIPVEQAMELNNGHGPEVPNVFF